MKRAEYRRHGGQATIFAYIRSGRRCSNASELRHGVNFITAPGEGCGEGGRGAAGASIQGCTAQASGWKRETDVGDVGVACEGERRGYARSIKLPPVTLSFSPSSPTGLVVGDAARRGRERGGQARRCGGARRATEKAGSLRGMRKRKREEEETERAPRGCLSRCVRVSRRTASIPRARTSSHPREGERAPAQPSSSSPRPHTASTMASGITRETSFTARNGHATAARPHGRFYCTRA